MIVLKAITTVLIVSMMLITAFFTRNVHDKASYIGFGFMQLVYVLALIGMWL